MFYQMIRSFLGPFVVILDFFSTRPEWLAVIFGAYLLMYAAGKLQLKDIKQRTHRLIEERCKKWLAERPETSDEQLFKYFYPIWENELSKLRYLFILNRHDLWPVSVTPQHILEKIPLSADYLRKYLHNPALLKLEEKQKQYPTYLRNKPKDHGEHGNS